MEASVSRNIRLGIFLLVGTALLLVALYLIGNTQNMFEKTVKISARFTNVNGLMKGNNVRFGGIDVGTVESVEIYNDTSIQVVMRIKKDVQQFIRKNAIAIVGTDGLMGNKLINIIPTNENAEKVKEGDVLRSINPVEMDEMVRTLKVTNDNIKKITTDLVVITNRFTNKKSVWNLMDDSLMTDNVVSTIGNLRVMSNHGVLISGNLKQIIGDVKNGKGTLGALITDTTMSGKLKQTIVKINKLSDSAAVLTGNVSQIVQKLNNGEGSAGVLLNDTTLVHKLNKSLDNIESGTTKFDENMEAMRYSWPFKKYFRKHYKIKAKK